MINKKQYKDMLEKYRWQFDLLDKALKDSWNSYEQKVNRIYNNNDKLRLFYKSKLKYDKQGISKKDIIKYNLPETITEFLDKYKCKNETEKHCIVDYLVNVLSTERYALDDLIDEVLNDN